jgi:O-antigen/teichoic acid export membrane protein
MRSFIKRIAFFSSINSLSLVLTFVNAMLLIRILGSSAYGIYSYLSAITAIIPTFFEFVDRTIVRFLGSADSSHQKSIFVFVITVKIALMMLILSIFLGWCWF